MEDTFELLIISHVVPIVEESEYLTMDMCQIGEPDTLFQLNLASN